MYIFCAWCEWECLCIQCINHLSWHSSIVYPSIQYKYNWMSCITATDEKILHYNIGVTVMHTVQDCIMVCHHSVISHPCSSKFFQLCLQLRDFSLFCHDYLLMLLNITLHKVFQFLNVSWIKIYSGHAINIIAQVLTAMYVGVFLDHLYSGSFELILT